MLRFSSLLVLLAGMFAGSSHAQELFVYSEPASNMPAKTMGLRVSNWLMDEYGTQKTNYHLVPEVMWGVNKRLMLHAEGFFSNRTGVLSAEGGAVYAKYRFYSRDAVYRHFRMAVFGRASTNNAAIHQEEIQTNGHNTGCQAGMIFTQLLHKTALSATLYYQRALSNAGGNEFPATQSPNALNYVLSSGHLFFPKNYTGYRQVNINLMAELMGQVLPQNGRYFVDIAPSVQFIINSQTRVDIGYTCQLHTNMQRTAPTGLLIRVEHLLYHLL